MRLYVIIALLEVTPTLLKLKPALSVHQGSSKIIHREQSVLIVVLESFRLDQVSLFANLVLWESFKTLVVSQFVPTVLQDIFRIKLRQVCVQTVQKAEFLIEELPLVILAMLGSFGT